MRDAVGNSITKGFLLWWKEKGLMVHVTEVHESARVVGSDAVAMLMVQVAIPIGGVKPGDEPTLFDFIRVMDPRQEKLLDAALTELPRRTQ